MPKKTNQAEQTKSVVVGDGKRHLRDYNFHLKLVGLAVICVVVFGALVFGGYSWYSHSNDKAKGHTKANKPSSKQLLKQISNPAQYATNLNTLKKKSSQLIMGNKNGDYKLSSEQLAKAYSSKADAELNVGSYKEAIKDYDKSAKINPLIGSQNLEGEFEARYQSGERKSLIPLLEKIVQKLKSKNTSSADRDSIQFQQYIKDIEAGQEIDL